MVEVSEAYTFQRCSRCGEIGNRQEGRCKCDNCGLETYADKNGAHNLAGRGIGKYNETSYDSRSVVTAPEAATVDLTSVQQVSKVGGSLC